MRISQIDFDNPMVIVLGAGASRGASFVNELPGTLPPLDSDFFTQAQRLSNSKPKALVLELIRNTVDIFGTNFNLTMEGFLTHIEHLSNVFEDYRLQGRPAGNPYPSVRQQFLQVLAAVLDEAIGRHPSCEYHKTLIHFASIDDTILSFNYDWLIDMTLRDHAYAKWNPRSGYGVDAYVLRNRGKGTEYWAGTDPTTGKKSYPASTVTLLKMHGSLNWFPVPADSDGSRLQLRQRWWHQKGNLRFEIAPPEWNKPIRSGIYQRIWRRARSALRECKAIAFLGYSLPPNDLPAQALFMVDGGMKTASQQKAPKLDLLVLVNPDRQARSRIRNVLSERIHRSTRVLTFDYFKDFAAYLTAE
jgi:hypothetical protein